MKLSSYYNVKKAHHNKTKSEQFKINKESITKPYSYRHKQSVHYFTEKSYLNKSPPKEEQRTIPTINRIPCCIKFFHKQQQRQKMRSLDLSNDIQVKAPSFYINTSPKEIIKKKIPFMPNKELKTILIKTQRAVNIKSRNNSYGGDLPEHKSTNIITQYQKNSAIMTSRIEMKNNNNTININNNELNSFSLSNNQTYTKRYIGKIRKSPLLLNTKIINSERNEHEFTIVSTDNFSQRVPYFRKNCCCNSQCSKLNIPFYKNKQENNNITTQSETTAYTIPTNMKTISKENIITTNCETNKDNINVEERNSINKNKNVFKKKLTLANTYIRHNLNIFINKGNNNSSKEPTNINQDISLSPKTIEQKDKPNINQVSFNEDNEEYDDTIINTNITLSSLGDCINESLFETKNPKNQPEEEHKGSLKIHTFQCESNFIKFQQKPKTMQGTNSNNQKYNSKIKQINELKYIDIETIFQFNNINTKSQSKLNTTIKEFVFKYSRFKNRQEADQFYTKHSFKKSLYIEDIEKDLTRTFPNNNNFKRNEDMLRNLNFILNVYAFANANIGYAQGMNFIVANSLFLFKDNVDVFYFLDGLIQLLNLEDFYGIKNKLKKKIDEFGKIVQKYLPKLHNYLKEGSLSHEFVTVNWALTLFSNSMERNMVFCVWDLMILYGWDFFNAFIVVVLNKFENDLMNTSFDRLGSSMKCLLKTNKFQKEFQNIIYQTLKIKGIINNNKY